MTSHELAKELLSLPDIVVTYNGRDGMEYVNRAEVITYKSMFVDIDNPVVDNTVISILSDEY